METPRCDSPEVASCPHGAREVILHRASENMVGNGMAVWSVYFRCGTEHHAAADAQAIRRADPEARVLVMASGEELSGEMLLIPLNSAVPGQ